MLAKRPLATNYFSEKIISSSPGGLSDPQLMVLRYDMWYAPSTVIINAINRWLLPKIHTYILNDAGIDRSSSCLLLSVYDVLSWKTRSYLMKHNYQIQRLTITNFIYKMLLPSDEAFRRIQDMTYFLLWLFIALYLLSFYALLTMQLSWNNVCIFIQFSILFLISHSWVV